MSTLALVDSLSIAVDSSFYMMLLTCAANAKSLISTRQIHTHALINLTSEEATNPKLICALVHSYGRCGDFVTAVSLFEEALKKGVSFGVVEWNVLMRVYAGKGMYEDAKRTLDRMVTEAAVGPNIVSLACLVHAASHDGNALDVREVKQSLLSRFPEIEANDKFNTCVIDGLARRGLFDEALSEIKLHGLKDNIVAWMAVMGAARNRHKLDFGELALKEILRLDPKDAAARVMMCHIYIANGLHEEARQLRGVMENNKDFN